VPEWKQQRAVAGRLDDAASFLNGKKAQIIIDGTQSRSGMFQAGSFKLGNFYGKK